MKPIPLALLLVGGLMAYAGHMNTTPLAVLRATLTGQPMPHDTYGKTAAAATSQASSTTATATTPGGNPVASGVSGGSGLPTGSSTFGL